MNKRSSALQRTVTKPMMVKVAFQTIGFGYKCILFPIVPEM